MKRPALMALITLVLYARGIIEYYRPLENEALIKLQGQDSLYIIRHLTALPEDRLNLLLERLQSKEPLQLIFDEHNHIIDIRP